MGSLHSKKSKEISGAVHALGRRAQLITTRLCSALASLLSLIRPPAFERLILRHLCFLVSHALRLLVLGTQEYLVHDSIISPSRQSLAVSRFPWVMSVR